MGLNNNNYVDLKGGDRITLRNGNVLFYDEFYKKITNAEDSRLNYGDNLKHKVDSKLDVVEIKRPIEYETIFTEEDVKEDDSLQIDDVIARLEDELKNKELVKGSVIVIKL